MRGIFDLKQNGLKVIVIDPRYTETASKADLWLPLRPGSDVALALAWLNVIIWEGLYDQTFIENCCIGFEELAEHVRQYTPEWAAPLTWLDAELIRKGARMYATTGPATSSGASPSTSPGDQRGAGIHARALLRAVTGNLDAPGSDLLCGPSPDFITDEEMEANDWLPEEQKAKQIGSDRYKLYHMAGLWSHSGDHETSLGQGAYAEWMCEAHPPSVFRAILTEKPYQPRALLVLADNPLSAFPDSRKTYEALKKLEFLTVMDYWLTPTAMLADYVLPAAGWLERPTITSTYGCTDFVIASQRAVPPTRERRTSYHFWKGLGATYGTEGNVALERPGRACITTVCSRWATTWAATMNLWKRSVIISPSANITSTGASVLPPLRRVELYFQTLKELGYEPMPTYAGPAENENDNPELAERFPLTLIAGGGFMPFYHSEHRQIKPLRFLHHQPLVQINPATARELGIREGDWVWIETLRGRIKQVAALTEAVHPRTICTERGWWFPERKGEDPSLYDIWQSNSNVLTSGAPEFCDPKSGSWANRGLLCRVYKVEEEDKP